MNSAQNRYDEETVPTLNSLRYCIVTAPQFWAGRHQEIRQELQEESCRKQGVTYGRRITGGDIMCLQRGDFFCELHCKKSLPVCLYGCKNVWLSWEPLGILFGRNGMAQVFYAAKGKKWGA